MTKFDTSCGWIFNVNEANSRLFTENRDWRTRRRNPNTCVSERFDILSLFCAFCRLNCNYWWPFLSAPKEESQKKPRKGSWGHVSCFLLQILWRLKKGSPYWKSKMTTKPCETSFRCLLSTASSKFTKGCSHINHVPAVRSCHIVRCSLQHLRNCNWHHSASDLQTLHLKSRKAIKVQWKWRQVLCVGLLCVKKYIGNSLSSCHPWHVFRQTDWSLSGEGSLNTCTKHATHSLDCHDFSGSAICK